MTGNPMMFLLQAARSGKDPMSLLRQMAGQNPQMAQFMQMIGGKSPAQLQQMAENMARERGIDINRLAQQMGVKLPK